MVRHAIGTSSASVVMSAWIARRFTTSADAAPWSPVVHAPNLTRYPVDVSGLKMAE